MHNFFEHPWLLLGLIPFLFMVITLQRTQKKLAESMVLWVSPRNIKPLSAFWFIKQNLCLLSGMLFLIFAAAGPLLSNHKTTGLETRHGLVVIALKNAGKLAQASFSLQARLLSQIQKEQFDREGGRIGLMPYGGKSDLFCPLTLDPEFYEYIASSLKRVAVENSNPETMDGVLSLGEALKNAVETLQSQTLNSKQLMVILFENLGSGELIKEEFIKANIPQDIGLTLIFPETSKVPETLGLYCAKQNANAVALDSRIIPEDRVFEVLKKGDSSNVLFQGGGVGFVAAPMWFALPGLLCLLIAFVFPPNIWGLVSQLPVRAEK